MQNWHESKEREGTGKRKWILKKQQNVKQNREITGYSPFAGQVKSYFKNYEVPKATENRLCHLF